MRGHRSEDVEQATRPNKRVYELTPAGREALRAWVAEPSDGPRVRDEFFIKLILAPMAGLADRMALMNAQRRHYLGIMRSLAELQADLQGADAMLDDSSAGLMSAPGARIAGGTSQVQRNLIGERILGLPKGP